MTGSDIEKALSKLDLKFKNKNGVENEGEKYLAIKMDVMKNPESQRNGEYTVETSKAEMDLKKAILDKSLVFPESLKIGLHIIKGMSNLHEAGYVHGDGKNDNVLLYKDKDDKWIGRIADLGKTQKMKPGEKGIFVGNPRFAAPEGNLSQSGEIYTTAILIINTLEGEFLKIKNEKEEDVVVDMLIPQSKFKNDPNANTEGRFGIEKFLILNKQCLQTDNSTFNKRVKILGREIESKFNSVFGKSNTTELEDAQKETDRYVDALCTRLSDNYPAAKNQIDELKALLKEMTRAKVGGGEDTRTKSLKEIIPRFQEIIEKMPLLDKKENVILPKDSHEENVS